MFDLESVVYSHAISPVADHLLIACATQHPAVRLADLRSGSTAHSLAGHGGAANLSVAWSPSHEHILASGASDGSLHIWDVRRSFTSLGVLDLEDSTGILGTNGTGRGARKQQQGNAHVGPVNGLTWTADGRHLVSVGHDEKVRVWDMDVGANTLASFGPIVRNAELATLSLVLAPQTLTRLGEDILLFPNGREILMFELYEGQLLKRMKAPSLAPLGSSSDQRNLRNRVMDMCWRPHHTELLSAHADGSLRSSRPHTNIDATVEELEVNESAQKEEADGRKRKREQDLDEIYRELTAAKVTFS